MFWDVWSTVEGALDESRTVHEDEGNPDEVAASLAWRLSMDLGAGEWAHAEWEVYILPHYCDDGGDCDCAQWLDDHRPAYSSATFTRREEG